MYDVLVMSLHTFTLFMTIRNALLTMRLIYSVKYFLKCSGVINRVYSNKYVPFGESVM